MITKTDKMIGVADVSKKPIFQDKKFYRLLKVAGSNSVEITSFYNPIRLWRRGTTPADWTMKGFNLTEIDLQV